MDAFLYIGVVGLIAIVLNKVLGIYLDFKLESAKKDLRIAQLERELAQSEYDKVVLQQKLEAKKIEMAEIIKIHRLFKQINLN